jgi:thymidylate kinase
MSRPSLITLSGLDGSGKSTQIEFLKNYLKSQDKTFFYFHGAGFSVSSLYK